MHPDHPVLSVQADPVILRSTRRFWQLHLKEVFQSGDLLFLLIRRDFLSKYKQTILGPTWFVIQPVLMTIMFTFVFGHIAHIPTDGIPNMLFYLSGLLGWNYLSQTLSTGATIFTSQAHIFQKVYFPRLVVPLSIFCSTGFIFLVQLATFLTFYGYYRFTYPESVPAPTWYWLWSIPFVIQIGLIGLGCSLIFSAVTARYRDLAYLVPLVIQLWMYATPIIYPLTQVPSAYRLLILLNPVAAPTQMIRTLFFDAPPPETVWLGYSLLASMIITLIGLIWFKKTEFIASDIA